MKWPRMVLTSARMSLTNWPHYATTTGSNTSFKAPWLGTETLLLPMTAAAIISDRLDVMIEHLRSG
jgi:hypothetical protein